MATTMDIQADTTTRSPRRPNTLGVHSLDRFVFSVPDLGAAERFYGAFGLDPRRDGNRLDLYAHGHPHCWGSVHANGQPKRLQHLCFGAYEEDFEPLARRIRALGTCDPHPLSDGKGIWLHDPDGTPVQVIVAPKVSPSVKAKPAVAPPVPMGKGAAPSRSGAPRVRPRRLAHVLLFTPDVPRQVAFYSDVLGLRLSDRSGDIIAFMHAPHASEHHLVAFAKSGAPGLHHSSWDVGSIDDIGLGAEYMRAQGYVKGWGVGRHVLGSNYFYYVQDPWGSWAEYSFDIDFVPVDVDWPAADHPPEDSFYVWGPSVPDDFVVNREQPAAVPA
ncbi:MAG TPA: VOC family protein [Casimicrobiaceae bacterium]|nr:VOC family protein [Casimicrobiaceae bacterium]